jgi:endonuclease III
MQFQLVIQHHAQYYHQYHISSALILHLTVAQVLCAVVLSSRAQNSVVREAIRRLGKLSGGFTANTIAHMDTEELAQICKSVHYNKVLIYKQCSYF